MMCRRIARGIVRNFDVFWRRILGVWEFSQDEKCLFRLAWSRCHRTVRLPSGMTVLAGEPMLELHLWNEHIPPMPPDRVDPAWSVHFLRRWLYSLDLLARYWQENPDLADVRVIHGVFAIPGGEGVSMQERTLVKLGFDVAHRRPTPWRAFTDFWENLYNWAIIWTFNPASLRSRRLLRMQRCDVWMPRERLMERLGGGR